MFQLHETFIAHPAAENICSAFASYYIYFFYNSNQTNYLTIYLIDLRQIFRVGRTMTVDDQSEIVVRSLGGCCHGNQFLLALSTELISIKPVASGTAGWANVGRLSLHLVTTSMLYLG